MKPTSHDPVFSLVPMLAAHRIEPVAVAAWLQSRLPKHFDGKVEILQFLGGNSNPTYRLGTNAGTFVLRKKPLGVLLPSAHAIEREYRVMHALRRSAVPVPQMLGMCDDASVIGTPFFVMHWVSGQILGERLTTERGPSATQGIYDDMARVLARLHTVDWRSAGLETFGRPQAFLERQITRWSTQWTSSRLEDLPVMDSLRAWLLSRVPSDDEAAIVHGDYRLGNMLIADGAPSISALLDWELATLGHPLTDVGYFCAMYHLPPEQGGCDGMALQNSGIPTKDAFVQRYALESGRGSVEDLSFYIVFSMYRLASIAAGVYRRAVDGNASDPRAIERKDRHRVVAEQAWRLAQRS